MAIKLIYGVGGLPMYNLLFCMALEDFDLYVTIHYCCEPSLNAVAFTSWALGNVLFF